MKKSEFKTKAENFNSPTYYSNGKEIKHFAIYSACQFRWEDTANPQIYDGKAFLTEEEAIQYADSLKLEIDFRAKVVRITFTCDNFNEAFKLGKLGEEFKLEDLNYKSLSVEQDTIYESDEENGGYLPEDGYIVYYRHHTFMNYAYKIESIESVQYSDNKTFSDLRCDEDSTSATYAYVAKNLDELAEDFEKRNCVPFDKINSGSRIVREFLKENGHPNYIEESEEENG
ncbi:MAG: hypothetical protein K2X86_04640 [Cytophagaceae bacterium]|nr:hypothetical protein [Cytophagaceae bacterium]